MYQIWQAPSDKVRTSSSEQNRMTDLGEGQFQFSTRSHQKEGIFQVFCIQVNYSSQLFHMCYSIGRLTHHSHFHPLNFNQHHHQCNLPLIMNSQDLPASPASRVSPNQQNSPHKLHQPGPFKGHPNLPKTIIQLLFPKNKNKAQSNTYTSPKYSKKNCVNE